MTAPYGATRYEFTARRHPMEHWQVAPDSLLVLRDGREQEADVHRFVSELLHAPTTEVEAAVAVGAADLYFRSRGRRGPATGVRTGHWLVALAATAQDADPVRLAAGDGEQLVPLAALLHRDPQGHSFLGALVEASSMTARAWVREWLHAYVRPLVLRSSGRSCASASRCTSVTIPSSPAPTAVTT